MRRNWPEQVRLSFARLKVEHPLLTDVPTFPRFRSTQLILWLFGLGGLVYGHFYAMGQSAKDISLILSSISWCGSVFIVLLREPYKHFQLLMGQILTLLLATFLLPLVAVAYTMFIYPGAVVVSLKIAWLIGVVLLGLIVLNLFYRTFVLPLFSGRRYPGFLTSPLLFALLILNSAIWYWPQIIHWLRF